MKLIDLLSPADREFRWRVMHDLRDGTGAGTTRMTNNQLLKEIVSDGFEHQRMVYQIHTR